MIVKVQVKRNTGAGEEPAVASEYTHRTTATTEIMQGVVISKKIIEINKETDTF
jgi:hypothetical protein